MIYGGWATLLEAWQELDVPEGWRAEIVGEQITIAPPPGNRHTLIASRVHEALIRVEPDDCGIFQVLGVSIPLRLELFVPDLVVMPRAELVNRPDNEPVPAELALLVVEITSPSTADTDRSTKRWGYAHAQVPLYLLIDRSDNDGSAVMLYSDPVDGRYRRWQRVPFGAKIGLPEPFGFDLDTGEF